MSSTTQNPSTLASTPTVTISPVVLENLAARFRVGGLCVMLLRSDGSVSYHDSQAGLFFNRYVLPVLQYPETATDGSVQQTKPQSVTANVGLWYPVPGVVLAAFSLVEKKHTLGVMMLAGKGDQF